MGAPKEICVEGISIALERKQIKHIHVKVKPPDGRVAVSAPLWVSNKAVESIIENKLDWIKAKQEQIRNSPQRSPQTLSPEEKVRRSKELAVLAEPLIEHWSNIMHVKPGVLAYRDMTSRWGSCNPQTGRICLNLKLLDYPRECLEYLVVHELCHLLERGHGPKFKALMNQYLPDWEERRKLLRRT